MYWNFEICSLHCIAATAIVVQSPCKATVPEWNRQAFWYAVQDIKAATSAVVRIIMARERQYDPDEFFEMRLYPALRVTSFYYFIPLWRHISVFLIFCLFIDHSSSSGTVTPFGYYFIAIACGRCAKCNSDADKNYSQKVPQKTFLSMISAKQLKLW